MVNPARIYLSSSLITVQNLVAVSLAMCVYVEHAACRAREYCYTHRRRLLFLLLGAGRSFPSLLPPLSLFPPLPPPSLPLPLEVGPLKSG